jgi:glycosyltransferase involved in cell wall biosynthesis
MRIAAHNGASAYGGGEKWTVLLLRGLQERGHAVHLFCNHAEIAAKAEEAGVPASVQVLGGHLMLPQAWTFSRRLRRYRADALLISTFKKVWLGAMAGAMAGVPRVVSRIGLDSDLPSKHWSYRMVFRRWVDAALVNADGIRRDIVATFPDYAPDRVATVYDGIPPWPDVPARSQARAALGLPQGVPLVGSVCRLSRQKRLDRFLETLALLPEVHGVLAGAGELEAELRAHAHRLGLEHRVHFLGFREDVARVLGALDVFLVTSDHEGMANAMLEAMSVGIPVVSTPVSGAEEALGADSAGRCPGLVVPPDAGALSEATSGILQVAAVHTAMALEGGRRAAGRFSYTGMLDAWEGVLGGDSPARWHRGPSGAH